MSSWHRYKLGDIAEIRVSNVDKKSVAGERGVVLCNYMDVYANDYIRSDIQFMEATASLAEIERFKVLIGDVLITKDSETPCDIGIPAVVVDTIDNLVCGYHLALIKPKTSLVDPIFLSKQLASSQTASYFSKLAAGSTRYGLSNGAITKAPIFAPDLERQRKISQFLIALDQTIEKTEALIEKYQQIKAGLMHDLFTRGVTADGKLRPTREQAPELYQETPIGWIPKDWDVKVILELANVVDPNPSHRNPIYHVDGFPFISTVEFIEDDQVEVDTPRRVIEEIVLEQERRCKFSCDSIAFSRKGTIGSIRFLPDHLRFALLDSLCVINPTNVDPCFLFNMLRSASIQKQTKNMTMGQALPQMSIGRVRELQIPTPRIPAEQIEIGVRLKAVSDYISKNHAELKKLQKKKQGLMLDLLTGKVEVKVEESEAAHV